jgi:pyruvate dehydrogenase E1 component alpha subunit
MGTPIERATALEDLSLKACSYNMAHASVDGMDVLAVRDAVQEAVERARNENAPTLIEAKTYRYMGHSMSDPTHGVYRTKADLEEHKRFDPIKRLSSAMEAIGILDQDSLQALDEKIAKIIEEAVAFADSSPEPAPEDLYTDVYEP